MEVKIRGEHFHGPIACAFYVNHLHVGAHTGVFLGPIKSDWSWFIGKKLLTVDGAITADNDQSTVFQENLWCGTIGVRGRGGKGRTFETFLKRGLYDESAFYSWGGSVYFTSSLAKCERRQTAQWVFSFQTRQWPNGECACRISPLFFNPLVIANHRFLMQHFFFPLALYPQQAEASWPNI